MTIILLSNILNVIVFGSTGPVGSSLVHLLSKDHPDWTILAVTRSPVSDEKTSNRFSSLLNVKMVQCDVYDLDSVLAVCNGSDVIFSCIGLCYERKYWAEYWPLVVHNLLNAVTMVEGKKKKLVFCDNIYCYGPGINISPKTKKVEGSTISKPGIRSTLHQIFENHMQEHPGTLSVVGGADCFGPTFRATSQLGNTVTFKIVDAALKGNPSSSIMVIGSCDVIHDFCYVDDFAKALAIASVNDTAYDKFWICPHSIHNKSQRQIANDIAKIAYKKVSSIEMIQKGDPVVSITTLTKWKLYLLSFFIPVAYEMIEMLDYFSKDYTVDDHDFCTEFHIQPTPYEHALKSYVDFYIEELKSNRPRKKIHEYVQKNSYVNSRLNCPERKQ